MSVTLLQWSNGDRSFSMVVDSEESCIVEQEELKNKGFRTHVKKLRHHRAGTGHPSRVTPEVDIKSVLEDSNFKTAYALAQEHFGFQGQDVAARQARKWLRKCGATYQMHRSTR